jgi:D-alanyl-D-alanine carboxypeptidase
VQVWRIRPARLGLYILTAFWLLMLVPLLAPAGAVAAPYAAFVIDARTGEVLHARNADTRLHPASLTKMMTLYIAFEAIRNGEISLDTKVRISRNAANEPPSKLGLKSGQRIALRYLIRAAAVKSANDAATAIGEAISGSEAAFVRRMNRTAKAMGMTRTTFKNANGLTQAGHLSTARDMTNLGRRLLYDYPQYYNLFSRRSTDTSLRTVRNTNRKFLDAYRGADGIKTGYTSAAGFNLVASAKRGNERIIATMFGGKSTAARNAKVAELLDLGFRRAPSQAPLRKPAAPRYAGNGGAAAPSAAPQGGAPVASLRPRLRPSGGQSATVLAVAAEAARNQEAMQAALQARINAVVAETTVSAETETSSIGLRPEARPQTVALTETLPPQDTARDVVLPLNAAAVLQPAEQEVVTRLSTSGGQLWGINVGRFNTRYKAERVLLRTALAEMATLDGSLRKVVQTTRGFDANFLGLTRERADLACRRLQSRNVTCFMVGP